MSNNKSQGQQGQQGQRPAIQLNPQQGQQAPEKDQAAEKDQAPAGGEDAPKDQEQVAEATASSETKASEAIELNVPTDGGGDSALKLGVTLEVKQPEIDASAAAVPTLAPEVAAVTPKVDETTAAVPVAAVAPKVQAAGNRGTVPNMIKRPGGRQREASPAPAATQATAASTGFVALIAKEKQEGSAVAVDLIAFLERYVVQMDKGRITSLDTILRFQEGLLDQIMNVVERAPSNQFKRLWRILIMFVGEYRNGAFSPTHYARGARDWKRDPKQFDVLASAINLLEASQDMRTVNQVANVTRLANLGFSEEGRGRLVGFYSN